MTTAPGIEVHCQGLVHIYQTQIGAVVSLRGVDLDVAEGEAVALVGPSGSGKSTLLSLLAGLLTPTAGRVLIGEWDLARLSRPELARLRADTVGMALQDSSRNLLPYATAEQNVQFAHPPSARTAARLLSQLGIPDLARRQVSHLGGGERQQVALAVAVASQPRLLLLDEPTNQLQADERDRIIDLIKLLNSEVGMTVIAVTHDDAVASSMPRTVTIRDGRVGAEGRRGENYAVVGRDGTVQLPPNVIESLPPGTLLRVHERADGIDLERISGP